MQASFEKILSQKRIFRDRGVLSPHYVPEQLLFREKEVEKLMTALAPLLEGTKSKNLFVYGKTGVGKSVTVKQVMKELEEQKNEKIKIAYMNCRVYDSRYKVLQKCISLFNPNFAKTGHSFAVLYEKLLDWIEGVDSRESVKGKNLVIVLDEIDMVKDLDNLIYTLTRTNDDLTEGSLTVIGISNKINFKQRLDPRSKSSLCEEELVFQPYNANQLQGILKQRIGTAFYDNIVEDSAVNLAAAIAAGENGDARYALLLLLRAGELAEQKKLKKLTDKEVEEARRIADEDKAFEVISSLPEHQQLVLYALAILAIDAHYKKLVEDSGEKLYFSGEVYEKYASLAKKIGKEPRTARWYREYLNDLEMLGLLVAVGSGKGVRGHTTLLKLAYEAPKVKKAIEKSLLNEGE